MIELQDKNLRELQRIKRALEVADERTQQRWRASRDPEIQKYIDAIIGLQDIGAFQFNAPKPGAVGVIENTVAVRRFDQLTLKKLAEAGVRVRNVLGFHWPTIPVLIGPREVISPRYHPRQKPLLDRIRTYYRLKRRAGWQLDLVEEWLSSGIVPCSYQQTWQDYGAAMLLPRRAVSHDEYRNPHWAVLSEATLNEVSLRGDGSLVPQTS